MTSRISSWATAEIGGEDADLAGAVSLGDREERQRDRRDAQGEREADRAEVASGGVASRQPREPSLHGLPRHAEPAQRPVPVGEDETDASSLGVLRGVLEVVHLVVAEVLEDAVLRGQQAQRRAVGGEVLDDGVLRHVERVALLDLVPGRLLGDARVVLLRDLLLHLPVQRVAVAVQHVEDLVGHLPVLARSAAGGDVELEDVDAELAHVGAVRAVDARAPGRAGCSPRPCPAGLTTFLRSSTPGGPDAPTSPRAAPNSSGRSIGPLRPCWIRPMNIQVHLAFMTSATAFSSYGLKCRCTESVCTRTQVALLPVVPLVVVDLVAGALEDVERGLVLVAVAVVGAVRRQLDEVHLERLGQELLVARADPPPGAGLLGVAGVTDLGVVDDHRVVARLARRRAAPARNWPSP